MCSCRGVVGDVGHCDGSCASIAGMEDRAQFSPRTTVVDRDRAIIVRESLFRWRWTYSRQRVGCWQLVAQGVALTRGGAIRLVQRRMRSSAAWGGRLDRMEIESARQHSFVVSEKSPAPATELLP
jgi:hypothetical protein